MKTRSRNIQSIERAMGLLEHLKRFSDGASLADLCEPNGLTKSTAHGLISTLVDLGYVSRQGTKYRLGARTHALASTDNEEGRHLRELFSPALKAFNEVCATDCFLAVPSGSRSFLILDALGPDGMPLSVLKDSSWAAIRTSAIGKVFMAHDLSLARQVRRSAPLARSLEEELLTVSQDGFALDNQGSVAGLSCLAIPLRLKGQVVAALGASGSSERLSPSVLQSVARRSFLQLHQLMRL